MKVDFPQPESAARPMTMGTTPSANAIWRVEGELTPRRLVGMKELVKAEAVAAARAQIVKESFMVERRRVESDK